jgi:nitrite reductase (NADH) small subunit
MVGTTEEIRQAAADPGWVAVCRSGDVERERPVCAVVAGKQVAIVRTYDDALYAVSQRDPFTGAFVMSRGIVGSRGAAESAVPTLQSPLFKQAFDLCTGRCLDDPGLTLDVYAVRDSNGVIEVAASPASTTG